MDGKEADKMTTVAAGNILVEEAGLRDSDSTVVREVAEIEAEWVSHHR
jgi:hypothetical protein